MLQTRITFTYENYLLQPVLSCALLEKKRKDKSLGYIKYVALYYPQVVLSNLELKPAQELSELLCRDSV